MSASPQQTFLQGLGLGIGAAALLFYFWHTEAVYQLQQQWLAEQKAQLSAVQQKPSAAQNIETIDLLMKSYAVTAGTEDADMREALIQSRHLELLQQLQQSTQVDISDLVDPARPFNAAQLYAALLRIKQQQEKQQARKQLDARLSEQKAQPAANPDQ
ncbi:hypothetical protein [Rheinheimera texasensis]|uniref:hypothetical protein n=1 Tax=Rheinheimera texasensis TaxID=306205 RepID=UPI0004E1AA4E|nr:hypothetical protein [Rheinheimera texasensis]